MEYRYRAAGADGRIVTGTLAASTPTEVDVLLLARGLQPIASEQYHPFLALRPRVSRRDLAVVFRSLASLVTGGVPLARAMAVSEGLPRSLALRNALEESRRLVTEGRSLTEALAVRTGLIPGVVLGMLRAGERGSKLAPALEQAATHLEQEAELAGRVQQALAYPLVLLVAGFVSVTVITIVVVPRFATILADLGQAMPSSTRALLLVSDALRHHGLALLAAAAIAIVGLSSWVATPHGRLQMHRLLLRLPIVGALRLGFATARMTRAIGGLLGSGVPMTAALSAARESAGDQEIARRLERASERVTRGEPVAVSLRAERALTPVALQLIAVGESSGQLAAMAERAAAIATLEAEGNLRALVSLLEPALVVVFGGMVAFTAVALLQAVYSLRPG